MSAHSDLPATSEDLSRALANVPEDQRTWVNRSCPVTQALACLPAHTGTDRIRNSPMLFTCKTCTDHIRQAALM